MAAGVAGIVPSHEVGSETEAWEGRRGGPAGLRRIFYTLQGYLQARAPWIPNYRQQRIEQQYIGSAHVEQANDLLVARRQKNRGMQWSEATSDALAALRTLMLNGGWERYWQHREVLPLLAS